MTIVAQTTSVIYAGDGSTSVFPIANGDDAIYYRSTSHIHAIEVDDDGVETTVVFGSNYNISGGPSSGTLTRIDGALPSGYSLVIWREQPIAQETDFSTGGDFAAADHESTFDRITEILQEIRDDVRRSIKVPRHLEIDGDLDLPATDDSVPVLQVSSGEVSIGSTTTDSLGGTGGSPLPTSAFGAAFVQVDDAGEGRDALELGDLATQDAVTGPQMTVGHAALSHDTIIAAYNQANSAAVLRDIGQWVVESATATTPPTIVNDEAYLIPTGASGVWAAQVGNIAYAVSGVWTYKTPARGWRAFSRDTDAEWHYDGSAWTLEDGGSSSGGGATASDVDGRVRLTGTVNGHGGAKYQVAVTQDGRLLVWGDTAGFVFNPVGDKYAAYQIPLPWDPATVEIEAVYCGINYILVQTDQATGNLYHLGSSANGQGGNGSTSAVTTLTAITAFSALHIERVWTEANRGNSEAFWFALTSTERVYSCGYSGAQHVMGYNSTTNLSTPRQMTQSDGVTPLSSVTQVVCGTAYAPVWIKIGSNWVRHGAGTDGAHGYNSTSALTWPTQLETTFGSGVARTDISSVAVAGAAVGVTHAVSWLLTSAGKIEVAGGHDYGNGDGTALGPTDRLTFTPVIGAISALTVTSIHAGGGATPICVAITSTGQGYIVGRGGLLGNGSTTDLNTFTIFSGLPSGFAGALTSCIIAGGYNVAEHQAVYLEATVSGAKRLAAIGYDNYYATAAGIAGVAAASKTWGVVKGTWGTIDNWYTFGTVSEYGLAVLNTDGELRYAGAGDQGQSGTQQGLTASVDTLQVVQTGVPRLLKPITYRGSYSAGTSYSRNDVVRNAGTSWIYVAASASTGNSPPTLPTTSNAYWEAIAEKGDIGPVGAGDVVGPASATNGGFAKFDGTTGKLLKNSAAIIAIPDGGSGSATAAGARANFGFATTTTDNAIARFDGVTGATQDSVVTISDVGVLAINSTEIWNLANQTSFPGTQWIGSGGSTALSAAAGLSPGNEGRYILGVGLRCLTKITTGSYDVMGGFESGEEFTTATWCSGWGEAVMSYHQDSESCSAWGWKSFLGTPLSAGVRTVKGVHSNFTGASSAINATGLTVNYVNGYGGNAFFQVRGPGNTGMGHNVGYDLTTGTFNLFDGYDAGRGVVTGSYNNVQGPFMNGLSASLDSTLILGAGYGGGNGVVRIWADDTAVVSRYGSVTLFSALTNGASVDYLTTTPGTGTATLASAGASSAVSLTLNAKGNTTANIGNTQQPTALSVYGVPSGVNYLVASGAITAGGPYLQATGTDSNVDLLLKTTGTGVLRMQAVTVVGTVTPPSHPYGTQLYVGAPAGENCRVVVDGFGAATGGQGVLVLRNARGTVATPTAMQSGDLLGSLSFWGYGATTYGDTALARVAGFASESWTDSAKGANLALLTTPNGSVQNQYAMFVGQNNTVLLNGPITVPSPATFDLESYGVAARSWGVGRHPTADTAGNNLTIAAGGATASGTNRSGGNLVLRGGTPTGTGTSGVQIQAYPAGSSGTSDGTVRTVANFTGSLVTFSLNASALQADSQQKVATFANADGLQTRIFLDGYGGLTGFSARRANNTAASPTAPSANQAIFQFLGTAYGATGYGTGQVAYTMSVAENWTDSAQGTYQLFSNTPIGSTTIAEVMRITDVGNVKIGGTANRGTTEGTRQLVLFDGTAPVGTLTNGVSIYSTAGEMRVMDAAGNATLLSPHDKKTNEWVYDSVDTRTGRRLHIKMEQMLKALNEKFGWDYITDEEPT